MCIPLICDESCARKHGDLVCGKSVESGAQGAKGGANRALIHPVEARVPLLGGVVILSPHVFIAKHRQGRRIDDIFPQEGGRQHAPKMACPFACRGQVQYLKGVASSRSFTRYTDTSSNVAFMRIGILGTR